jgi:tetratricopeptide (TPR) repeat protein
MRGEFFQWHLHQQTLILFCCLCFINSSAQEKEPRTARAYYALGEELLEQENLNKSLDAFTECLRIDPLFADAYYSRGLVRERLHQQQEALVDYSVYLTFRHDHYEAIFNRANLRYQLKQFALAKEDFEHLLYLPKQETSTVYFRQAGFGGGVNQVFTSQSSGKDYLFNWLGLTETQLGNYSLAILHFDSAIHLHPTEATYFVNRGIAHQQNGEVKKARYDFEKALELHPHLATANYNLSLLSDGDSKKGALLDAALAENASIPYIYAERAYDKMKAGNFTGALYDYNEAIRLDPTEKTYFLNRGLIHEKLLHYTAAYQDYTHALRLDEHFEKAWLNRGNVLMRQQLYEKAIDDYTNALLFNRNYGQAFYNRALAYQKTHHLNEACKDIQRAEALSMKVPLQLKAQLCK